jgi:oligoribonuclease NrnB/cAMP/cGMP phosphodiesterase (DHH superfamily)
MIPKFVSGSSPFHTMKFAIVYHSEDFDGKLSNEVCRYWLNRLHPNANIHSYGWDYGRPVPVPSLLGVLPPIEPGLEGGGGRLPTVENWSDYDAIYIVDLSVDELMARPELRDKIVWIDHHKSAIEKWDTNPVCGGQGLKYVFTGIRIDGVAACRLCWQWFLGASGEVFAEPLTKQLFIDRKVKEPDLIRLAGEYDIWDHRDPDAKALQFGLRGLSDTAYRRLVDNEFLGAVTGARDQSLDLYDAVAQGYSIKSYVDKQSDEYSAAYAHTFKWEGLTFCALNIGQRGNSDLLKGGIKPEHDACFAWRYDGKQVLVSLYHIEGKTHHDLSLIAVKYKGGGHKGACGFRISLGQLEKILNRGAV